MATRSPNLRHLDRSCECWLRNYCRKPKSIGIAETKCHPGRQKDQKMLKIMWCAGRWHDGCGTQGSNDDDAGEQPGHSLKNRLHHSKGPRVDSQPVVHAVAVEARRGP